MTKAVRIGRREIWRYHLGSAPARLRESYVWVPLLAGALLLGLATWWYADDTAFRRRAVTTSAVIEQLWRPPPVHRDDGLSAHSVQGRVRFRADGAVTRANVVLYKCVSSSCVFSAKAGDTVEIAYDPREPTRAVRATVAEGALIPGGWALAFGSISLIFLFTGIFNLVLGRH